MSLESIFDVIWFPVQVILFSLWLVCETWMRYVAAMHLKLVRRDLHPIAKAIGYGYVLIPGLVLDFLLNAIVGTAIFRELPRELTLTSRLRRLKKTGNARQKAWAFWLCDHLLDQFDRGGHC